MSSSPGSESTQLFLQCILQRAAVSSAEAKDLYRRTLSICGEHTHTRDFSSFVSTINRQLKPLGMELARGNLENSGETWYSVVNRSEDAAAKIAAAYSPAELELFNKAVEMMVLGEDGRASSTLLLRAVPSLKRKLSHLDAQTFLRALVRDKWFEELLRGVYVPGPRFILELRPFLKELFPDDIIDCRMCKDPVIQGQSCADEECNVKIHLYCAAKLFRGRTSFRCPGCHGDWPHPIPHLDPDHQPEGGTSQPTSATTGSASGPSGRNSGTVSGPGGSSSSRGGSTSGPDGSTSGAGAGRSGRSGHGGSISGAGTGRSGRGGSKSGAGAGRSGRGGSTSGPGGSSSGAGAGRSGRGGSTSGGGGSTSGAGVGRKKLKAKAIV